MENGMEFKDPQVAFNEAIEAGIFSTDPQHTNFAGNWMYMGTHFGVNQFKHNDTRKYLKQ